MAEEAGCGESKRQQLQEEGGSGAERDTSREQDLREHGAFVMQFEALQQKMDAKFDDIAAKVDDASFEVKQRAGARGCERNPERERD